MCFVCSVFSVRLCLCVCVAKNAEEEGTNNDVQRKNVSLTVRGRGLETACFIDDSEIRCGMRFGKLSGAEVWNAKL